MTLVACQSFCSLLFYSCEIPSNSDTSTATASSKQIFGLVVASCISPLFPSRTFESSCRICFLLPSWYWKNPTQTFTLGRDNTHTLYTSCALIIKKKNFKSTNTKTVDYREDYYYMMQDSCDASNRDFSRTCVESVETRFSSVSFFLHCSPWLP